VVAGGNGLAPRSPGGAVRQIEPSLGHPQQVRAVGEAGGGVREFETMQGELPILILLDHVGSFPQFGNAFAWINQEPATHSPKLGKSL